MSDNGYCPHQEVSAFKRERELFERLAPSGYWSQDTQFRMIENQRQAANLGRYIAPESDGA